MWESSEVAEEGRDGRRAVEGRREDNEMEVGGQWKGIGGAVERRNSGEKTVGRYKCGGRAVKKWWKGDGIAVWEGDRATVERCHGGGDSRAATGRAAPYSSVKGPPPPSDRRGGGHYVVVCRPAEQDSGRRADRPATDE